VRPLENAVLQGQAVFRMAEQLKAKGLIPDVVYGHSGWGPTLLIKDIFPKAKLLCYFEWFYHAHGSDADFDLTQPLSVDDEARIRVKNAPILIDLYSCDQGLSPTYWQRQQFPSEYQSKISVLHDGIDTDFFCPKSGAKLVIPRINLDLSHVEEVITYVARGMEPYRGFPEFMEAVAILQQRRPQCHVVIVGENRVAYGKRLPDGKTYKEFMLDKLPIDQSRVHFTGWLPYNEYLQVLQASSAHVYLTRPFVLSWSMLESLSTGCLVIGSRTHPVTEVIEDGVNGLLADFFSPQEICARIEEVLNHPNKMAEIRAKARETVITRYNLSKLLPKHIEWIQGQRNNSDLILPSLVLPSNGISTDNLSNGQHEDCKNIEPIFVKAQEVIQVCDCKIHAQEILPLLTRYQILPQFKQGLIIDEAIETFSCTVEEQVKCCQEFWEHQKLTSEVEQKNWLQQHELRETEFVELATRNLRIEKFKQATWGKDLEPYFLRRKQQLDQVVYSLIRTRDADLARELYFRLLENEQPFADLARQYSLGAEAQTGGLIGPVALSLPHPKLAQILIASQVGQLSPPTRVGDWWTIVRLEKLLPAKLDEPMQQRLLNELFDNWIKEKLQSQVAGEVKDVQNLAHLTKSIS
jgi:glycosyltransferase involved in cell wall biosynthesis